MKDLPHAEAFYIDVLGLKLGTVRSRIHRGRAMLRAALAHVREQRYMGLLLDALPAGPSTCW